MHTTTIALVEGNLARSLDVYPEIKPRQHRAEILEFPRSRQVISDVSAKADIASCTHAHRRTISRTLATFIIVSMFSVLAICAYNAITGPEAALDAAVSTTQQQTIVVKAGSSLWSLAEDYDADGLTTRQTVDLIKTWNHLDGGLIHPGDTIIVPAN